MKYGVALAVSPPPVGLAGFSVWLNEIEVTAQKERERETLPESTEVTIAPFANPSGDHFYLTFLMYLMRPTQLLNR